MSDKNFKVKTGLDLPAPLPVAQGGTGQTTAANAINALLPSQTSQTNKILSTDGTNVSWTNPGATYGSSAPSNPVIGQLWADSNGTFDALDPYIIRRKTVTASAGQTVFTTDVTFTDGYEQVYYNGVLLVRTTDYTTSGGTNTVTLLQGSSAGDTVEIISTTPVSAVNSAVLVGNNTFTGNQIINSSGNSIDASNRIRSREGFRVTGNNGSNEYQLGPFYNFTDFHITHSTDNFTSHTRRVTIDTSGNVSIGNANTLSNTRIYIHNDDVNNPVQSVLHNVNAGGSRYHILTSGGADAMSMQWDNNNALAILQSYSTYPLTFRTNSSERMRINANGDVNIGGTSNPGDTLRFFDIYNANSGNSAGSIIRLITNNAANTGLTTVDIVKYRNGNFYIMNNDSAGAIILSNAGSEKLRIGNANDHVNMGMLRTWNLGQPTNNIVSGGTNCIRLQLNRSGIYYRGFVFDVYMGGGYDWSGNGFVTYFGKFMVTFTGTTDARVHLIQEYGRSYINNSGTEITYNTFSYTTDATYMYLNINFKGFNASTGYRPQISLITYDAGNGGSTSITGASNQVYNVTAI